MADALDNLVAQAVYESRLMERALHDASATWEMRWRGLTVLAERVVTDDGVAFYASFPALPGDDLTIWLLLNGSEARSREMDFDVQTRLDFEWKLSYEGRTALQA